MVKSTPAFPFISDVFLDVPIKNEPMDSRWFKCPNWWGLESHSSMVVRIKTTSILLSHILRAAIITINILIVMIQRLKDIIVSWCTHYIRIIPLYVQNCCLAIASNLIFLSEKLYFVQANPLFCISCSTKVRFSLVPPSFIVFMC